MEGANPLHEPHMGLAHERHHLAENRKMPGSQHVADYGPNADQHLDRAHTPAAISTFSLCTTLPEPAEQTHSSR